MQTLPVLFRYQREGSLPYIEFFTSEFTFPYDFICKGIMVLRKDHLPEFEKTVVMVLAPVHNHISLGLNL